MRRSIIFSIVFVILLLSLASCSTSVGVPDVSGSLPRIIPGVGAGDLRLGMTQVEVIKVMGEPEKVSTFPSQDCYYYNYLTKGVSVLFKPDRVTTLFLYSGIRGGYEKGDYAPYAGITNNGITVKSNYIDVLNAYGAPLKEGKLSSAPIPSKWISFNGISFSFIIETDQLIYLTVKSQ